MNRILLLSLVVFVAPVQAGLHYSAEQYAELPSRRRGFLLDQRALRQLAVIPPRGTPANPMRERYQQEAARLSKKALTATLSADEAADLGAVYLRLGDSAKALEVLRPAFRAHPVHYRLAANLGTAWQAQGDLAQAAASLQEAVRLAPGKYVAVEKLHLQLVRLRQREKPGTSTLDNLYNVRFVGPSGKYEAGIMDAFELKKLPTATIAQLQLLALWLPGDARLLWQLAEMDNASGDVITAAAIMDGCVTEFGLRSPDLLAHRKIVRAAADKLAKLSPTTQAEHTNHGLSYRPRSSRPLISRLNLASLPAIDATGINPLAWELIAETTVDRRAKPTFPKYLKELEGKQVEIYGYMQALGDNTDLGAFMLIEHPIGCWYCEMPEMQNIVLIELPKGMTGRHSRDRLRITGQLVLNSTDPENFLYLVRDAKIHVGKSE